MDLADVRSLATELGLDARFVTPVLGGWVSSTYEVGGRWIIRVARTPAIAEAYRRESQLLPELAGHVSFAVPRPAYAGEWESYGYVCYPKIRGRPLAPGDRWISAARMLRELHGFPAGRARELLGRAGTWREWREAHERLWGRVEADALPLLDRASGDAVRERYERFLHEPFDFEPALVHGDLGTEHVLVDPITRDPAGVIDFEDTTVGDPAIDFVGLRITLGAQAVRRLLREYGGGVSWARLHFYWWMAAVQGILHGVESGHERAARDAVADLRRRLAKLERTGLR